MEKRTFLAIALSILVLVVFSYITPPKRPVRKTAPPQQKTEEDRKLSEQKEQVHIPLPLVQTQAGEEKEIKVENSLYSVTFTTLGGTVKSWTIKGYSENGSIVELVPQKTILPPLSIIIDESQENPPPLYTYTPVPSKNIILNDSNKTATLTFFHSNPSGFSIKKSFTFYHNSYRVYFSTEVTGVQKYAVSIGTKFGISNEKGAWVHIGPVLLKGSNKIDIDPKNIEGIGFFGRHIMGKKSRNKVSYEGEIRWIAQEDKYFTAALAPLNKQSKAMVWSWGDDKKPYAEIAYVVNGNRGDFLLYAGPKKIDILKTLNVGLEHIVDFGMFSIIARPLFWLLKYLYKVVGNYGWAIVILTIIVRVPFIPLLNKSQKSMKKLQQLQPQMAAIKEQYKKDPQRMQKEMMQLYKKHKVNPVGGCLPMLIQLPVFLALYKILLISIELKGAPFILWITDLAAKDPYYIMPVVMGITMVIQQKMTPTSMDPKQAKMMMLMPVVFTFMFLSFPAGLVLYWLVNNTLGIIQQYFINKKIKAEKT
jgi:YidC/Oxa1 family membrane protein insertase